MWFDRELTGGQSWWDQILEEVRGCDVFVFALAQKALNSAACTREYEYADELGKPIMPILVAPIISTALLPAALLKIHFVDYLKQDKDAVLHINKALEAMPGAMPLPDPFAVLSGRASLLSQHPCGADNGPDARPRRADSVGRRFKRSPPRPSQRRR